jgi:hypothetical protein
MKKRIILAIAFILVFLIGITLGCILSPDVIEEDEPVVEKIDNVKVETHENKTYYVMTGEYSGEYDYTELNLKSFVTEENIDDQIKLFNTNDIVSYTQYVNYCKRWGIAQKYNYNDKRYLIMAYASPNQPIVSAKLANMVIDDHNLTVYLWEDRSGLTADIGAYVLIVPVDFKVVTHEVKRTYTENEFENIKKYGTTGDPNLHTVDKPVIYIYPNKEMKVNVKLGNSSLLTTTYPKYNNGWNVVATPNGNLYDKKTNKNYYALYWEGRDYNAKIKKDGFVVKGSDTIKFLEEKLTILGLSERETNEFMMYWLPKLENNKYNYIRFSTEEEINNYMPLEINPKPETLIRVVMTYKPLDKKIEVEEQQLLSKQRVGYTVVEWGGSIIK